MDSIKLELLKNKEVHAQSAIASQEVREHLAGFIRSKRLGSSTQLNLIAQNNNIHHQTQANNCQGTTTTSTNTPPTTAGHQQNQIGASGLAAVQQTPANGVPEIAGKAVAVVGAGCGQQDDDHPLRKTASMPSMHVPYKAQSLSRRRQMERRTTISPLMKRKSRPRKQLLHSSDSNSNSNEYFSNPCIIRATTAAAASLAAGTGGGGASSSSSSGGTKTGGRSGGGGGGAASRVSARSLSQSNSPPPFKTNNEMAPTTSAAGAAAKIGDESMDSAMPQEQSVISQQQQQQQQSESELQALKQQHHLKVNEAIRKTVLHRASSRGKIGTAGGSLDIELSASVGRLAGATANQTDASNTGGAGDAAGLGQVGAGNPDGAKVCKEELRQWSLDGADCRAAALSKLAAASAANRTLAWGMFHREFHKLRLATTSDAATLRRSQSPNSSISMGVSTGQTVASVAQQQQQPQQQQQQPLRANFDFNRSGSATGQMAGLAHLYSSSSSSTSSLLSAQDSLEDSSSQAIDLSSSSEASRQQRQQSFATRAGGGHQLQQSNRLNYQKVLQDSFNQLQLCQGTQESMKRMLFAQQQQQQQQQQHPPTTHASFNGSTEHRHSGGGGGCDQQRAGQHFLADTRAATSLDIPARHHQQHQLRGNLLTSLAEQFNLSASAQNLIASQEDQPQHQHQFQKLMNRQHHHHHQPPAHDLNNWLLAYNNNLVQQPPPPPSSSSEFNHNHHHRHHFNEQHLHHQQQQQQQQQQCSHTHQINGSLLAEMNSLPEPYRSTLMAQLIQHQQQVRLLAAAAAVTHRAGDADSASARSQHHQAQVNAPAEQQQQHSHQQQRLMIGRALSSPLLIACNSQHAQQQQQQQQAQLLETTVETPMQSVEFQTTETGATSVEQQSPSFKTLFPLGTTSEQTSQHQQACDSNNNFKLIPMSSQNSLDLSVAAKLAEETSHEANKSTTSGHQQLNQGGDKSSSSSLSSYDQMMMMMMMMNNGGRHQQPLESGGVELMANHAQPDAAANAMLAQPVVFMDQVADNLPRNQHLNRHQQPHQQQQMVNCSFIYNPEFDQTSKTGLIYELEMCNHKCICASEHNHPENSFRILAIWRRLYDCGLMAKCAKIKARRASIEELQLCHRSPYERIKLNKLDLSKLPIEGLTQLECGGQGADIDTAWNEEQTPTVARLAAGCVIEAAFCVAEGRLRNAFAIVRPPGHHAEFQQAMGFCFFNSIAISTRVLLARQLVKRVLIVDWDVHHGNGLQKMFYDQREVMYISLHRHDKGNFFPGTGNISEIGVGDAMGFNWNIAWSNDTMSDAEYIAAFRVLVMPIARQFEPSIVLVACGFDGARGHPLNFGGYQLSPACFAYMTRQLASLAAGKLVLCLEGGYQLAAICDCAEACLRALLSEPEHSDGTDKAESDRKGSALRDDHQNNDQNHRIQESELRRGPNKSACETLFEVSHLAAKYWPEVERWRATIEMSALEANATMPMI